MKKIAVKVDDLTVAYNYKPVLWDIDLEIPEAQYYQSGGKKGVHSESFGYILTELQYMQRAYPNMAW